MTVHTGAAGGTFDLPARAWTRALHDASTFIEREHAWPSSGKQRPGAERAVARWISLQRRRHRAGALTPAQVDALDGAVPGWEGGREAWLRKNPSDRSRASMWDRSLREAVAFIARTGEWPSRSAGTPAEERSVANWLHRQQRAGRSGALTPAQVAALDDATPGWRQGRLGWVARHRYRELVQFVSTHGRLPRRTSVSEEIALAGWLKRNVSSFSDERVAEIRVYLPEWDGRTVVEHVRRSWEESAHEFETFVTDHGRWPSEYGDDLSERSLGFWLRAQRRRPLHVRELERFARAHNRLPRHTGEERSLAIWLANQRTARKGGQGRWDDRREALFQDALEGLMLADRWKARADELARFTREYGRWPQQRAVDPAERSLSRWRQNQRNRTESPSVDGFDRRAYLDQVAPGWAGERREASVD